MRKAPYNVWLNLPDIPVSGHYAPSTDRETEARKGYLFKVTQLIQGGVQIHPGLILKLPTGAQTDAGHHSSET